MRLIPYPLVLAFLAWYASSAEPVQAQEVRVGTVLGFTSSTIHEGHIDHDWGRRRGGLGGISLGLALSPILSVYAEVEHLERGIRDPEWDFRMDSDYLEVPLYLRAVLPKLSLSGLRPIAILGAAIAREHSCGGVERLGQVALLGAPTPPIVSHDCSSMRSNRLDVGLLFGAGAEWSVGESLMRAEFRYTHGLLDRTKGWPYVGAWNRTLAAVVGVEVPLAR